MFREAGWWQEKLLNRWEKCGPSFPKPWRKVLHGLREKMGAQETLRKTEKKRR